MSKDREKISQRDTFLWDSNEVSSIQKFMYLVISLISLGLSIETKLVVSKR